MRIEALDFNYNVIDRPYLQWHCGLKRPNIRSLKARQRRACCWRAKEGESVIGFDLYVYADRVYLQIHRVLRTAEGEFIPYAMIDSNGKVTEWLTGYGDDPELPPYICDAAGQEVFLDRVGLLDLTERQQATVKVVLGMVLGRMRMGTLEKFLCVATRLMSVH